MIQEKAVCGLHRAVNLHKKAENVLVEKAPFNKSAELKIRDLLKKRNYRYVRTFEAMPCIKVVQN